MDYENQQNRFRLHLFLQRHNKHTQKSLACSFYALTIKPKHHHHGEGANYKCNKFRRIQWPMRASNPLSKCYDGNCEVCTLKIYLALLLKISWSAMKFINRVQTLNSWKVLSISLSLLFTAPNTIAFVQHLFDLLCYTFFVCFLAAAFDYMRHKRCAWEQRHLTATLFSVFIAN